jgi:putative sigma-54 modulation protein
MRLELTGRHADITAQLRRLVDRKLARLERMMNDSALSAQVVLTREKNNHRADVTLHARGEKFLHGVGVSSGDWSRALSQAVEKITQQAQRVKGKWQERKRRGRRPPRERAAPGFETRRDGHGASRASVRPRMPPILRASRQAVKAMSVADAAREVEAMREGLVVFRDAETEILSVIFRRTNGELTLVQTEN